MTVLVGQKAPDFSLENQFGETVKLSDFAGKNAVALVFYPLAFSGICQGELCEIRDNLQIFDADGVELLAVSVDSRHTLRAWSEQQNYTFNLLADFWPHGEVAKTYGVFVEERGIANRATFLIDEQGIVRSTIITEPGQARDFSTYRDALAELRV